MGYIEYLKGGLDTNGNIKWYYRFFSTNHVDVTEHFAFIGRKVRLKYCTAILINSSPEVLYETLNGKNSLAFRFYNIPELGKAQRDIDSCNNHNGCDGYCSAERRQQCSRLIKHYKMMELNSMVKDAIETPFNNYINKGTKADYDKKASKKLSFDSFSNVNKLNAKYNIPKYTINQIVNNGNTCRLIDDSGHEHVIDIANILKYIIDLKIHVTNLDIIRNWKNFS